MRRYRSGGVLLLCTLMILSTLIPVWSSGEEEAAAPSIRVWLRRLPWETRADLVLTGEYLAETASGAHLRLPEGTALTVTLRETSLYLFFGGYGLSAGESVTLFRVGEEAAFRAEHLEGRYPGDLSLSVSNGAILPVLTLSVEEYLRGVVPFEMSDFFPLEALKAQAVCARTYALSRRDASRVWDVTDDTNDQVFRGLRSGMERCDRAVAETAGLVATKEGKLIPCYFGASNGGQTELPLHVWPDREAPDCYAVADDPYDLENPASRVQQAKLNRDGSQMKEAFRTLLLDAAAESEEILKSGWTRDSLEVKEIRDIRLTEPRFPEPNRLMTRMEMEVRISGTAEEEAGPEPTPAEPAAETKPVVTPDSEASPEPAASEAPDPEESAAAETEEPEEESRVCTVTLNLFPDVEKALNLSISVTENELITVEAEKDGFRVISRRFGHGVGMSQRGAQWMAGKYGKNFREILAFYYPGMELRKAPTGKAAVRTAEPGLAQTPGPAATPTPRPTLMPVSTAELPDGAWVASVEKIDDDSSLNLRAEPSSSGEILRRLYKHQLLIVLETCEDPEWVRVRTDVLEGYVMAAFLEKVK